MSWNRKAWLKTANGRTYLKRSRTAAQAKLRAAFTTFIRAEKSRPCTDCGGVFPPCVMDFDHVRGVKMFNLSDGYNKPVAKSRIEIAKCDLVCSNCHRIRTTIRRYGAI
jgi:hypothetical protein